MSQKKCRRTYEERGGKKIYRYPRERPRDSLNKTKTGYLGTGSYIMLDYTRVAKLYINDDKEMKNVTQQDVITDRQQDVQS